MTFPQTVVAHCRKTMGSEAWGTCSLTSSDITQSALGRACGLARANHWRNLYHTSLPRSPGRRLPHRLKVYARRGRLMRPVLDVARAVVPKVVCLGPRHEECVAVLAHARAEVIDRHPGFLIDQ